MKQQVIRKMSRVALLGNLVTPVVTIIPAQVGPPFSKVDICKPYGKTFEKGHTFCKQNHRSQIKGEFAKNTQTSATLIFHTPIRNKDDIVFANRIICTWNLLTQETNRKKHVAELVLQEAIVHDYIEDFYTEMSDEEFCELMTLEKRLQRQCKDAIESYYQFVLNNMEALVFGRLVPKTDVPDDKILFTRELVSSKSNDKHRSSKNKKEKFSRYKKRARKNKDAERDFFMQDWINDSEDHSFTTLADVEEEKMKKETMTSVEKAYHDFVTDPCVEEAAWAIYNGTEFEHAEALAKAYQLLSDYQKVAMLEN